MVKNLPKLRNLIKKNFRMAKPKTSMFVQELSFTRATPTSPQTNTGSGEDPRKLKTKSAKYSRALQWGLVIRTLEPERHSKSECFSF